MYTVILAALLTTGADQTQGWHRSCHSCYSCHSSCSCSCYCSGCSCYCSGCSCSCSCYGSWCSGCYCSGCSCSCGGWSYAPSCYCGGCSCYCSGCSCNCDGVIVGSVYSSAPVVYARAPSAPVVYASVPRSSSVVYASAPKTSAPATTTVSVDPSWTAQQTASSVPSTVAAPARVVINVPAAAKLWVENVACPLTGDTRAFSTAALQPGSHYFYNLKVETPEGAQQTRRVELIPGRTTEVDFRTVATVQR